MIIQRNAGENNQAAESPGTSGTLFLCATPIGNLEDVTFRLLRILQEVDLVAAEDTRQTRKLLSHYRISVPLTSLYAHNEVSKTGYLLNLLCQGHRVALVSDAGLPGIADPGERVVAAALAAGYRVEVIPGPSAGITALALSGLPSGTARFAFEGFLPRKEGPRRRRLEALAGDDRTLIFYESPHRLLSSLETMLQVFGPDRPVCVARELTKKFETIYRGSLAELAEHFKTEAPRGEFTLVVSGDSSRLKG